MASYDLGVVEKMSVSCVVGCKMMFDVVVGFIYKAGPEGLMFKRTLNSDVVVLSLSIK
jgi:hypothetical protein